MAFQEPFDVFFQDFNNNEDGRSVFHYPVRIDEVDAWIASGGIPNLIEKCWIRNRETKVDAGDVTVSEDVTTLQLRLSESQELGIRPFHTIDGESKRFKVISQDNQEGIIYWEIEAAPAIKTATI